MMTPECTKTVWIMHAGALGDWVMVWPLLRALGRAGAAVIAVSHDSKAILAAERIECAPGSVIALPGGIDQPRLSGWWAGPRSAPTAPRDADWRDTDWRVPVPDRIITFVCDNSTSAGRAWLAAAAAEFPCATIEAVGPPGSASHTALWMRERVSERGGITRRDNPTGPIVCHIGAGSNDKRWPVERWAELAAMLRVRGSEVRLLAGEVERERLAAAERAAFVAIGGRYVESLADLAGEIAAARLFIGADTGPTHLAAQLGIPTLSLFGPTDPAVWSPVGPAVRVVAPGSARAMEWLDFAAVYRAANEHLAVHLSSGDLAAIDRGLEDVEAGRVRHARRTP